MTVEEFLTNVDCAEGCWPWAGYRQREGYGLVRKKGQPAEAAHRVAYRLFVGPIPPGMVVMHRCDNPPCVRPDHLRVGTQAENLADMRAKGRAPKPGTHCRRGHPFDGVNGAGFQICSTCTRARQARYNRKRRINAH